MTQTNLETNNYPISTKLWIYTNYDCNLRCSYCVAESHPKAPPRAIALETVKSIVDQAIPAGFETIFFTGGEPFILKEIFEMLAYAAARMPTTILSNAMLFTNRRMEKLAKINNQNLIIQVSLDGSKPEQHDPYRGRGSWDKTMHGLHQLIDAGIQVRVSTTETPANTAFLDEICAFCRTLGIPEEDHIIRPLAKRGFSDDGMEVGKHNLIPEMTINVQGVYWHPLSTDPDLLVSTEIFPLSESVSKIEAELAQLSQSGDTEMGEFQ